MSDLVLRAETVIPLEPDVAYTLFADRFAAWWPPEFSWSGPDHLDDIGVEPRAGGFLYELGPYGLRLDWGRVLHWEPPKRLDFTWQIGPDRVPVPDPQAATEVAVQFIADGDRSTRIALAHRGWERHGEAGRRYHDDFGQAWDYALGRLTALASGAKPRG